LVELIKYRLKATILEPMIALMIILFSITSAFTVIMKTNNHNNIHQLARAEALANMVVCQTMIQEKFLNEDFNKEGLRIEKVVDWYDKPNHLLKIQVQVYDNKNKLLTIRQRVTVSDDSFEK
jgi:hypothetical protein